MLTEEHAFINHDSQNLRKIYNQWHFHSIQATKLGADIDGISEPNCVVFCGMGGSGTSSDIISHMLSLHSEIPSCVIKSNSLPSFVNKRSCVIISSVSGNTLETIELMDQAIEKEASIIALTTGGRVAEKCYKHKIPLIQIPNLGLPRASLPYTVYPLLNALEDFIPNVKEQIFSSLEMIKEMASRIRDDVQIQDNTAKKIATFLRNAMPVCLASPMLYPAAIRFKNSLNENAKIHCIHGNILESSHNEIVPFTYQDMIQTKVILLKSLTDNPLVQNRSKGITNLFSSLGREIMELDIAGNTVLANIMSSIYLLDYATIYLASLRKVDPSPTPAIDILKRTSLPFS